MLKTQINVLGCFVNFLVIFRYVLDSFSQKSSKIWRNEKYLGFDVVQKLEFELKNWYVTVLYFFSPFS